MASNVVSPFSSGLPPNPTVVSHCSRSQTLHPSTTESMALLLFETTLSQANIKKIYVFIKGKVIILCRKSIPFTVAD